MKTKSMNLLFAATIICSALSLGGHDSAARASQNFAGAAPTADTGNETRVIGKVTLSGPAPADPVINMATDPLCSKMHPKPAMTEDVVLGPENAVANVLVYVSEGLGNHTFDAPKQPAVFEQKGCQYHPHVIALM